MAFDLLRYGDWVKQEVFSATPEDRLRNDWIRNWNRTLQAVISADGIFELISIICARWEFLGGLYCGNTSTTSATEAMRYVEKFLKPLNPDYANIHDLSGRGASGSEFFSVFRNKPFHGGTPAAILLPNATDVLGWIIGFDQVCAKNHLRISGDSIHVDGNALHSEFVTSLQSFAKYLEQDTDSMNGRTPRQRWQRGFWSRFKPLHLEETRWMQEGQNRGLPA